MGTSVRCAIFRALVNDQIRLSKKRAECQPKHVITIENQLRACDAALRYIESVVPDDLVAPQLAEREVA